MTVTVRPMNTADLETVVETMGQRAFFTDRLARQAHDAGTLLLAVDGDHVRGDVYVSYAGTDEQQVSEHLPDVPLLNHLEVHPSWQSRGIGTLLVAAAEDIVREQGHRRLALGVAVDNPRANALYERLGYTDWGHGLIKSSYQGHFSDGSVRTFHETITMLVKQLHP